MAVFLFLPPVIETLPALRGNLYAGSAGEFSFFHGFKKKNAACFSKKALKSRPVSLLNIPIHHIVIFVSAGCLHVPAAGQVPSKSGALNNPKTTGVKPNDDFIGNEIV